MKKRSRRPKPTNRHIFGKRSFGNAQIVVVQLARDNGLITNSVSLYVLVDRLIEKLNIAAHGQPRERVMAVLDWWRAREATPASNQCQNGRDFKAFYDSWEWKRLSYDMKIARGRKCECCGAKAPEVRIITDHIKPIRHHWHLRLDPSNLQILCDDCNMGKGSRDETDWRLGKIAEDGPTKGRRDRLTPVEQ